MDDNQKTEFEIPKYLENRPAHLAELVLESATKEYQYPELKKPVDKIDMVTILENTENLQSKFPGFGFVTEANNQTNGIDMVDTAFIVNLNRRLAPKHMGYEFGSVQPLKQPNGAIFTLRAHSGDQPDGPLGRPGDARYPTGSAVDSNGNTIAQQWAIAGKAPNELFYNEPNTALTGTGTQTSHATAPDYDTYTVGRGLVTAAGELLGTGGGNPEIAQLGITIDKQPINATTRKMQATLTTEFVQDLLATHGLDGHATVADMLSAELMAENNREFVNLIRMWAKKGRAEIIYSNGAPLKNSAGVIQKSAVATFDVNANTDGRWGEEKWKFLVRKIMVEANAIAKDTRRGKGNFIICSSNVADVLSLAGKMLYAPAFESNLVVDDTGLTFAGTLHGGQIKVFIDPYLGYDEVIVGYKGKELFDAGIFYAPYTGLLMHKINALPNSYQSAIMFETRYGIASNTFTQGARNANSYFRKFRVDGLA
jgi:hypothetical protein